MLVVACMLVGAVGGLSFLISWAGLREIRGWNRISIVIAFATVIGLAVFFDSLAAHLEERLSSRTSCFSRLRLRWIRLGLAGVLVVVAFLDQTGRDAPSPAVAVTQYESDSAFFSTVRRTLGAGAAVFDLPYVAFPEVPPRLGVGPYDEAVGFIFEPSLNWSFGFMRGRAREYPAALELQPVSEWMVSIAAIGFTGIVLDRSGYATADRVALEATIAAATQPPAVSADGRYSFFDLRAYAANVKDRLGPAGTAARAASALALGATKPRG
jgi:phosphoglycerol transferase